MGRFSHSHILPLCGVYRSDETVPRICIVSPWISNGDLQKYLCENPTAPQVPLVILAAQQCFGLPADHIFDRFRISQLASIIYIVWGSFMQTSKRCVMCSFPALGRKETVAEWNIRKMPSFRVREGQCSPISAYPAY